MPDEQWTDIGRVEELKLRPVQTVMCGTTPIALTYKNGSFAAISDACNHVGGPLGQGTLDGEFIVCPWHYWKFHRQTGQGEPGYEEDQVPAYVTKVENGRLYIDLSSATKRKKQKQQPHPLARPVVRQPGPVRVLGISTTAMTLGHPRYSTSDAMLDVALEHATAALQLETQCIKLRELSFRACEGFYSKSAYACTWPCSITQMDPTDQLDRVYEAIVHWADVILISTPIRWGNASSLYYKMVERMNCIQNQETIANKHLLKNKVAAFIIMGGQDNVQGVAGQLMTFFAEVGCQFPQFPFVAHSRGWSAEDMERNVSEVQHSRELREGVQALVARASDMAKLMVGGQFPDHPLARGGRKAHQLDSESAR
ncbi:Rieske 2Fe-2S domain-containing protein [Nitrospira lenta]|uniref:Putative Dioxygenase, ferredoxin subunit, and Flavodoxin (Modular protein) n=1 Tax=Nitrospira lenta TaxID=1436998 RepID=A0A330L6F4_9BACT|nr:Rieske 2Fe-2S domain-containing protein [Nitrospira lenta]SPP64515.1 putative Dioxygenase, ferredoxin subunit, and Flavodoxin (Modular protein) [Nitrospira lenta]